MVNDSQIKIGDRVRTKPIKTAGFVFKSEEGTVLEVEALGCQVRLDREKDAEWYVPFEELEEIAG